MTVNGVGNYKGSKKLNINIVPKGTTFTKVTGGEQQITLNWKRQKNITGYQIEYSLKKDFSGSKTVKIKKAKTLTTTIKKLQGNKTYYVRIRTYTTVKKKAYYSAWSKTKTVKTKGGNVQNEIVSTGEEMNISDLEMDDTGLQMDDILNADLTQPIEIELSE